MLPQSLTNQIREHHQKAQAAAYEAITHALEAGKLLVQAKEQSQHGEWLPFLESAGINARTAQRYMRLAHNEHKLKSDSVSHLSVTKALEYLSDRKVTAPPEGHYLHHVEGIFEAWVWEALPGYYLRTEVRSANDGGCVIDTMKRAVTWDAINSRYPDLGRMGVVRGMPVDGIVYRDTCLGDIANNGDTYDPVKPHTTPSMPQEYAHE